jgi:hypothetical protein
MPTPTERNAEQIGEQRRLLGELTRRVDKAERDASWACEWVEKLRATDEELRLKLARAELAVEELRKSHERWGGRAWQFATALGLLVLGAVLGYALKR